MNADQKKLFNHAMSYLKMIHRARQPFDLNSWASTTGYSCYAKEDNRCGTTACAMGYLALDPIMQSKGLHLDIDLPNGNKTRVTNAIQFNKAPKDSLFTLRCDGMSNDLDGTDIAAKLFGIKVKDADYIFLPCYYTDQPATAMDVVHHMEAILAQYS